MLDHAPKLDHFVRKLDTHARLSSEDKTALREIPFQYRVYEPGSYIVRENDVPNACGILVSGFAFRQKLTDQRDSPDRRASGPRRCS
jgi:hypothetical protein